jgi:phosphoribosyl 1,2-cyclic phosphodiesterase
MSLFITSLNSGSNGNCYYLGNDNEAVLIDVGISCKEVEKRMLNLGLSIQKVKAVFISHEHGDHIKGLQVLSKKYQLPIYITKRTLNNSHLILEDHLIKKFNSYEKILIGNLIVTPFPKLHDAHDPYSFTVENNGVRVGVLTDIGSVCEHVISNFKHCHAAFLEANYDDMMLENGNYPYYLKDRIRGNNGHLSNTQALELFINHKPDYMSHIILSHLSKDNNCPMLVKKLFSKHSNQTQVIIASRIQETEVFCISSSSTAKNDCENSDTQTSLSLF